MSEKFRIAVYCASSPSIDQKYIDLAFEVGGAIAQSGADLVWGGGKTSMMGAVARGARENGAEVIGVIPERLISVEFADEKSTQLHVVEDMRARKGMIEKLSQASITLPGGIGTLEEFFEIWVGRYLGFHGNPVVVCDPFGDYQPLRGALTHLKSVNFMKDGQEEMVSWCSDTASAIRACYPDQGLSS
ncbi:MAG: TIGR00730 family Rossman fold protein [Actinomycetes bacterium]